MSGARAFANALNKRREYHKSCAVGRCRSEVAPGRIFCPNHWFFLPKWLRTAIVQTFFDAEWDQHQDAIRQGCDFIDAAMEDLGPGAPEFITIGTDGEPTRMIGWRFK